MCNLYSDTSTQEAIRQLFSDVVIGESVGNFPPLTGIFPDYPARIIQQIEGRIVVETARWGMPSPQFVLKGRKTDPGVTNIRNTSSPHWRRWLGVQNRCLVPFTSFSENEHLPDGTKPPVWFAFDDSRPLAFFAGLTVKEWTCTRKVKEGEVTCDLFGFLTTEPNAEVGAIHPKAMPVILSKPEEWGVWLEADWADAQLLQRTLPDGALKVVARGAKEDAPAP